MSDFLNVLQFLTGFGQQEIDFFYVFLAAIFTVIIFLGIFLFRKFVRKLDVQFKLVEFLVKWGLAFGIEFLLIWIYSPKVWLLSVVAGILLSLYIKNKAFKFLEEDKVVDRDIELKEELADLKSKFKKNPHYSILEILFYYGYISAIQKELVETKNIFKTPEEMAKELVAMPVITDEQLREAIGIMNVIRREGKVLTREEAILHIMRMSEGREFAGQSVSESSGGSGE